MNNKSNRTLIFFGIFALLTWTVFQSGDSDSEAYNPYESDIAQHKESLENKPGDLKTLNDLAGIYLKLNRLDEAAIELEKVFNIDPYESIKLNKLKERSTNQKIKGEPVKAFKIDLNQNAEYLRAHNLLGLVYLKQQQYEKAKREFKEALNIDPDYTNAHNNLGVVYERLGRKKKAAASYKEAKKLFPDNDEIKYNLEKVHKTYVNKVDPHKKLILSLETPLHQDEEPEFRRFEIIQGKNFPTESKNDFFPVTLPVSSNHPLLTDRKKISSTKNKSTAKNHNKSLVKDEKVFPKNSRKQRVLKREALKPKIRMIQKMENNELKTVYSPEKSRKPVKKSTVDWENLDDWIFDEDK